MISCTLWVSLTLLPSLKFKSPTCSSFQLSSLPSCHSGAQHLSWEVSTRGTEVRKIKNKTCKSFSEISLWVFLLLRLLSQCTEYFDLRCQLLDDLTSEWSTLLLTWKCFIRWKNICNTNCIFHSSEEKLVYNSFWLFVRCFWSAPASEMEVLKVSAATMLEDEISWLDNFEPSWSSEMETSEADNILLAGHLRLIKTLLSLCGNEKEHLGD